MYNINSSLFFVMEANMGFFDDLSRSSDISRISALIAEEEERLNMNYTTLGKLYFNAYGPKPFPSAEYVCKAISESVEKIDQLRTQLNLAQGLKVCPKCGRANPTDVLYCGQCGNKLASPEPEPEPKAEEAGFCPQCGKNLPKGVAFCPFCGKSLYNALKTAFDSFSSASSSPAPAAYEPAPAAYEPAPAAYEPAPAAYEPAPAAYEPAPAEDPVTDNAAAEEQPATKTKICSSCGATNKANAVFCSQCGENILH